MLRTTLTVVAMTVAGATLGDAQSASPSQGRGAGANLEILRACTQARFAALGW